MIAQALTILLATLVPIFLLYVKKSPLMALFWLAVISAVDIFNSQTYLNLSAIYLFGLASIPFLINHRVEIIRNKKVHYLFLYSILLTLSGVYFGFLSPWPDTTGNLTRKDLAPFRVILTLGKLFLEIMCALFVSITVSEHGQRALEHYLRGLLASGFALVGCAFIETQLKFDFYHVFTGGRTYLMDFRARSLNYEPRGFFQSLSQISILTLAVAPVYSAPIRVLIAICFVAIGFYFTFSMSGIMVLVAGIGFWLAALLLGVRQNQSFSIPIKKLFSYLIVAALLIGLSYQLLPDYPKIYFHDHLLALLEGNLLEKLEVFDAAGLNFLLKNPGYLITGVGPGLVYLPSTPYLLPKDVEIWKTGFSAAPHMGFIYHLCNTGLIGISFLSAFIMFCFKRSRHLTWELRLSAILLIGMYLIQMRPFYLFGLGVLLSYEQQNCKK